MGLMIAAAILGLSSLLFNRPGNFNIRPEYKPGGKLILVGSYRFFRHPMYVSVLFAAIGAAVMQMSMMKMIAVVVLLLVLEKKARMEELAMNKQFPEYSNYLKHSHRWLPFNFTEKGENHD